MLPIKNIMVTKMVTVSKETPIHEAAQLLVKHNITGLPVIDAESKLVGILSEFDILRLLIEGDVKKEQKVEDFMTHQVITFEDTATAIEVCEFFLANPSKRRLPIVHDGKLVGIVTRGDIVKLIVGLRQ
jgi:CBS domain-containing protein